MALRTVQPEGKRPMDAVDWLHGVHPGPDDRLGS
jgi:methionyl-tRNA formyltransferase